MGAQGPDFLKKKKKKKGWWQDGNPGQVGYPRFGISEPPAGEREGEPGW